VICESQMGRTSCASTRIDADVSCPETMGPTPPSHVVDESEFLLKLLAQHRFVRLLCNDVEGRLARSYLGTGRWHHPPERFRVPPTATSTLSGDSVILPALRTKTRSLA
jgi:hypothetical protein